MPLRGTSDCLSLHLSTLPPSPLPPVLTRRVLDPTAMVSRRGVCAPARACLSHLCGPKPPLWLADMTSQINLDQHSTCWLTFHIPSSALLFHASKGTNLKELQILHGRVPLPLQPVPASHEEPSRFRYIKPQLLPR